MTTVIWMLVNSREKNKQIAHIIYVVKTDTIVVQDGVKPKIPPSLSFSGTYQKQFLLCRNQASTQVRAHQNILMMIFI